MYPTSRPGVALVAPAAQRRLMLLSALLLAAVLILLGTPVTFSA